jgi:NAD(P)-dependent dehydrogenase (short-subunit alcohol dehydrogenase family)
MSCLAVIVGAGSGISAAVTRKLAADGWQVLLAARNPDDLTGLLAQTGATAIKADASKPADVERVFTSIDASGLPLGFALYNASFRTRGALVDLVPADVEKALMVSAFGGFLVGQAAAKRMLPRGEGAIFFTGASASVKGYAQSAPFAMGKFALRGLAQSMARELQPKGLHIAHFVIDGAVAAPGRASDTPDALLDADAIADTYIATLRQPRSAWSTEVELRPWVERF